jgi:hypothetical protein
MDVVTIVSNAIFLVPAAEAVYKRRWTRFMIYILVLMCSTMYHACSAFNSACVFDARTHRRLDFFFAQLIIPLSALYVVYFTPRWRFLERILTVAFAFVILILLLTVGDSMYVQMALAGGALAIILVYWIGYAVVSGGHMPPYEWDHFGMAIALTSVSCVLYVTQLQYHLMYAWIHACWHSLAAMGQFFFLLIRDVEEGAEFMSLDAEVSSVNSNDGVFIMKRIQHFRHDAPPQRRINPNI